ncbi:DoxX family protein [Amycolatopsis sp. FDAARGOS 1241]|uniref:DoxX family protein n=1 Tax=Amycolatopsis sp. FDAARGOS 1241 TaxID=2778070 RepID=UPI001951AA28|nr:DoxX family protein [Amycolatopsis sp. FDAARGOS 1241]QRP49884.1 DoxX family protein [Amycolatopsis sp. FDAARGOS 1241]
MNIALWIAAGIAAAIYLAAGGMKLATPKEKLLENPTMGWVADFSGGMVKFIGLVEVLGAIGLILPQALGIAPVLTPLAAVGFVIIALGAIVVHGRRKEPRGIPMNVLLLVLSAFVAIGRFAG